MNYYANKILYALQKIEYAKSKMKGHKNTGELSKIYSVLMTYGNETTLKTIMNLTKLSREEIVPKLKELSEMGLVSWEGTYLNSKKEITVKKQLTPEFMEKLKGMKFIERIDKDGKSTKEVIGGEEVLKRFDSEEVIGNLESIDADDWVEINYSSDVILKVRKSKVKEAFL